MTSLNNSSPIKIVNANANAKANAAQVSTPRHEAIKSDAQSSEHKHQHAHVHTMHNHQAPLYKLPHAALVINAHNDAMQPTNNVHENTDANHANADTDIDIDENSHANVKNHHPNGIGQPRDTQSDTDTQTPLPIPTRPLHLNVTTDECSSPFTSQNTSPTTNDVVKTHISPRQVSASCSSSSAESHAKVLSKLLQSQLLSQTTRIQPSLRNGLNFTDSATSSDAFISENSIGHAINNDDNNCNDIGNDDAIDIGNDDDDAIDIGNDCAIGIDIGNGIGIGNDKISIKNPASTHRDTDTDTDGDDMCKNMPLSFTVDVASALDHVLNELDKDEQTKANANANPYYSRINHGGMPLDSSSFDSNNGGIRHGIVYGRGHDHDHGMGDRSDLHHDHDHHSSMEQRPCVLQQTSVVDIGSGATSPSGGASVGGNNKSSSDTASGSGDEKASVSVKSSMLVCEESLNMIAQMTAPPKQHQGQKKRAQYQVHSALEPSLTVPTSGSSTTSASALGATGTSSTSAKVANVSTPIASNLSSPSPLLPMSTSLKKVASETSRIKSAFEISSGAMRKVPLITGTAAAAQFEALNRKNGTKCSPVFARALDISPQLFPEKVSITSSAAADKNEYDIAIAKAKANSLAVGNDNCCDSENNDDNGNGVETEVKQTEKGMDMLADIILHAAPILSAAAENEGEEEQSMVPIGQSLSVYTAIAAQAGVATYPPLPLPTSQPLIEIDQKVEEEQVHVQEQEQEQSQPQIFQQGGQTYIREIGKIRRFCAATGEFSEWEDLPCQTYGDTEPRRWCELNIDESIEIPLRRGGRLRVFPNFVADSRRGRVSHSMDQCTLYRQYWGQENESSVEARVQVLLSSKTKLAHNSSSSSNSKHGKPGYVYDGVTMMAQPLAQVPEVESLGRDLAELYRLPGKEWNIGANLVCYRNGDDHMAWNSNCEQGEVLILCIIAESKNCTRPILIRPKGHYPLQDGDEEIIVFVGQGDAYEMDGKL